MMGVRRGRRSFFFFFFNDPATTEIYTLSLHDALPILPGARPPPPRISSRSPAFSPARGRTGGPPSSSLTRPPDRESARLDPSHSPISDALFCLNKKTLAVSESTGFRLVASPLVTSGVC